MHLFYKNYHMLGVLNRVYRRFSTPNSKEPLNGDYSGGNIVSLDKYRQGVHDALSHERDLNVRNLSGEVVESLFNESDSGKNLKLSQIKETNVADFVTWVVKKAMDLLDKENEELRRKNEELMRSNATLLEQALLDSLIRNAHVDQSEGVVSGVAVNDKDGIFLDFSDFIGDVVKKALTKDGKALNMSLVKGVTSLHKFHEQMIGEIGTQNAKKALEALQPGEKLKNAILKIPLSKGKIMYIRTITEVVKIGDRILYVTKFVDKTPESLQVEHLDSETSNLNSRVDSTLEFLKIMLHLKLKVQELIKIVASSLHERGEITQAISDIELRVDTQSKGVLEMSDASDEIVDLAGRLRMLALNALIEAARSGDSGAGFKVVAAETRSIADLSQELASSITKRAGTLTNDTKNIIANVEGINAINGDRTIIDSLERISGDFSSIIQSYSNLSGISLDLRNTSSDLKSQYDKKDILSLKEKIMIGLNLSKIEYKTLIADLMIQLITGVSEKDTNLVGNILDDNFAKFIESTFKGEKGGLNNKHYQQFVSINSQIRELKSQIETSIRNLNSGKSKKLTLEEINEIIETKLSPLVESILPIIDNLLMEIDSNYSKKLVKI